MITAKRKVRTVETVYCTPSLSLHWLKMLKKALSPCSFPRFCLYAGLVLWYQQGFTEASIRFLPPICLTVLYCTVLYHCNRTTIPVLLEDATANGRDLHYQASFIDLQ